MDRTSDDFDESDAGLDADLDRDLDAELDREIDAEAAPGRRRAHVESASLVAIVLAVGCAVQALVNLWYAFQAEGPATSQQRLLQAAGGSQNLALILFAAAALVSVHRALGGVAGMQTTRATIVVGAVAAAIAALHLAATVGTFTKSEGTEDAQFWAIRAALAVSALVAGAAFVLVTGDRE